MNEVEKIFRQETSEKKRIAHNASKRVGKTKKCTMPYEMLRGKERKEYMKPGEVKTVKLGPMPIKEFRQQPKDIQLELLYHYGETYGWNAAGIQHGLGVVYQTAWRMLDEFGIRHAFQTKWNNATKEEKSRCIANRQEIGKEPVEAPAELDNVNTRPEEQKPVERLPEPPETFFGIQVKGTRAGNILKDHLNGFALSLDDDAEYTVDLLIVQVKKREGDVVDS